MIGPKKMLIGPVNFYYNSFNYKVFFLLSTIYYLIWILTNIQSHILNILVHKKAELCSSKHS